MIPGGHTGILSLLHSFNSLSYVVFISMALFLIEVY